MSKLGKILLYVAFAGGIAAAVAGGLLIKQRWDDAANLAQVQQAKEAGDQIIKKDKAENAALKAANDDTTAKLTAANASVDSLNTQLAAAQKTANDATAAVQSANDAAKAAKDALDKINADLAGETPQQYKDDKAKAESDLVASQSEQKILQDQLQAAQGQVDELKKDINNSKIGLIPPGVSGKVTFVNRTWNFVVLDVGLSNGVVPNGELIVYRGKDFLGKVKVTSAEANSAVADILPDIKGDIQVGDYVLN